MPCPQRVVLSALYLGVGVKERALVQVASSTLQSPRQYTALVQSLASNLETNPGLRVGVLLDYCRGRCGTSV